ncbi:hypothetical protein PR202_gb15458 [Eleusine coracana subsp. coracana]|uniref:GST N-terminal domain-containing protein n=1 Tax=Eleusine coracana subsp. coracana TaxID=191504 RepID=A0AAV5EY19_ELECO|nr:hypothetical protein PR202_gb15458 [Eleusine coracana subsp. coracana]
MATEVSTGGRAQEEILPPSLGSTSHPPNLFDGTTRLYISYICPYVQRVWIARNYKGLQEKIQLVAIDLQDKPAWYRYYHTFMIDNGKLIFVPEKVPVLEHNGNTIAESLDLLKYLDANFEGPKLLPEDPEKQAYADELIVSSDSVIAALFKAGHVEGDLISDLADPPLNKIEESLGRFSDGPFLLGQSMSAVDMVYAPFIERFKDFFAAVKLYDMTRERPKLKAWIEVYHEIILCLPVLVQIFSYLGRSPSSASCHDEEVWGNISYLDQIHSNPAATANSDETDCRVRLPVLVLQLEIPIA